MKDKPKGYYVRLPFDTDMIELQKRLKEVKKKTGKTANAKIASYILKLGK